MERYIRLLDIKGRLYQTDCPICFDKGALLHDNKNEQNVLQLRFICIGKRSVIAAYVSVDCYSIEKEFLCRDEHKYLDIAKDGSTPNFGDRETIPVSNSEARIFEISISKVVFADGTSAEYKEKLSDVEICSPVSELGDLTEQFRKEITKSGNPKTSCKMLPKRRGKLWACTCGCINYEDCEVCTECGMPVHTLFSLADQNYLNEQLEECAKNESRIENNGEPIKIYENNAEDKQDYDELNQGKKKNRAFTYLVLVVILVCILAFIGYNVLNNNENDSEASLTEEELYAFAVYSYEDNSLRFYSDSTVPNEYETYNDLVVTEVYTGIETEEYSFSNWVPWSSRAYSITSVSFEDTISPVSCAYWFYQFENCESMNLENLDTSKVTDMSGMFSECEALTSLDVSGFDTSNVENMHSMFEECRALTSLDLSKFDTSKVTNMQRMFTLCDSLRNLDISSFDTSNVTNMSLMFYNCDLLEELDVSGFNTSNVTDMNNMFFGCGSLTNLDISGFDTSNVTDMNHMFNCMYNVTSLDLSNFNTSNVTDMSGMFELCKSLVSLDVSYLDVSKATDLSYMFCGCSSLVTIYASSDWKGEAVVCTDSSQMFKDCKSLVGAISFDESKVTLEYANFTTGYFTEK